MTNIQKARQMTDEERRIINQRDVELINAHADELSREAEDVLAYGVDPFDDSIYANVDRETWDLLIKVPISKEDIEV